MITYGLTNSTADLQEILFLQKRNLPSQLSTEEALKEGFVTVNHDFELLQSMHNLHPHVIAKAEDRVIGYALVMLQEFAEKIPILIPMFQQIHHLKHKGIALKDSRYVVMGQVCIDKAYRAKGVFKGLYNTMKTAMQNHFDYIITEISDQNIRSLKAHYKLGFTHLSTYASAEGAHWVIVLLDLS